MRLKRWESELKYGAKCFLRIEENNSKGPKIPNYPHEVGCTPFQAHYYTENLVAPEIEPRTSQSVAGNSDQRPQKWTIINIINFINII
jgi:hypothetical protein